MMIRNKMPKKQNTTQHSEITQSPYTQELFKRQKKTGRYEKKQIKTITTILESGQFMDGQPCGKWVEYNLDGDRQTCQYKMTGDRLGAVCRDQTWSTSTGQGACSYHGGVDHWVHKTQKTIISRTGKFDPQYTSPLEHHSNDMQVQTPFKIQKFEDQWLSGWYRKYKKSTGKTIEEGFFQNGQRLGNWIKYNEKGDIKIQNYKKAQKIGAICNDGQKSSSTAQGACLHHNGVKQWVHKTEKKFVTGTGQYDLTKNYRKVENVFSQTNKEGISAEAALKAEVEAKTKIIQLLSARISVLQKQSKGLQKKIQYLSSEKKIDENLQIQERKKKYLKKLVSQKKQSLRSKKSISSYSDMLLNTNENEVAQLYGAETQKPVNNKNQFLKDQNKLKGLLVAAMRKMYDQD